VEAAQFTLLVVLVRVVFRRPRIGDHFGHPRPIDWPGVAAATVGVAGAVAGAWLVYGLLPWWASLAVGFVAGAACERLADSSAWKS
jgi:hypothetical protein